MLDLFKHEGMMVKGQGLEHFAYLTERMFW